MTPHSSTLAWKIQWTEEPGGLQSVELLRVGHDLVIEQQQQGNIDRFQGLGRGHISGSHYSTYYCYYSGEDNGTPLQYSCLENPMDGGAW